MGVLSGPRGRELTVDAAVAAFLALVMLVGAERASIGQVGRHPLDALAYMLMAVAAGALVVRRVWPLVALAVTLAATVAYLAIRYPYGPIVFPLCLAMYSVAVRMPVLRSLVVCCLGLVMLLGTELIEIPSSGSPVPALWLTAWFGWLLLPWAVGTIMRGRWEAFVRAREDERRRHLYEERLEIAREVHDIVGHGLAVINMQAGVALHVLAKRPEQARIALEAIRETSKHALDELRVTLAVFRASVDAGVRRPTPSLAQLDALVDAMTHSGLPVDLVTTGTPVKLPASVDLAAYRIVQESLTNVLRHAGPAKATVRVSYEPSEVIVEVTDDGRGRRTGEPRPGGHGIAGMRERAAAVGGILDAGPRAEGGFRVLARLPLRDSRS